MWTTRPPRRGTIRSGKKKFVNKFWRHYEQLDGKWDSHQVSALEDAQLRVSDLLALILTDVTPRWDEEAVHFPRRGYHRADDENYLPQRDEAIDVASENVAQSLTSRTKGLFWRGSKRLLQRQFVVLQHSRLSSSRTRLERGGCGSRKRGNACDGTRFDEVTNQSAYPGRTTYRPKSWHDLQVLLTLNVVNVHRLPQFSQIHEWLKLFSSRNR